MLICLHAVVPDNSPVFMIRNANFLGPNQVFYTCGYICQHCAVHLDTTETSKYPWDRDLYLFTAETL